MTIIERLAKDLTQLLERELTGATVDLDRLYLTVLLLIGWKRDGATRPVSEADSAPGADDEGEEAPTEHDDSDAVSPANVAALQHLRAAVEPFRHGNPYLNGLLFRDYVSADAAYEDHYLPGFGPLRLHREACRYVDEVLLLRRLQPAKKTGQNPTNLHLLLETLCRHSRAADEQAWLTTQIRRRLDGDRHGESWFQSVAQALIRQRTNLGDAIGTLARNRRTEFGPYWLHAGTCAEQVGEELNLCEVLEIAPKPLRQGFGNTPDFTRLLRAVVDSLNTRYRLLRACGLPPEDWLHRDEPAIDRLKELARLRRRAVAESPWHAGRRHEAFAQAFQTLLPECAGAVGGFENLADWLASEVGQAMCDRGAGRDSSLSALLRDPEESQGAADLDIADADVDIEADAVLRDNFAVILHEAGPQLAGNPVLQAFFHQVLVQGREFADPGGLLQQPAFQAACAVDPRYATLSVADLSCRLFSEARATILDVLLSTCPDAISPSPLLREYTRWVFIEEKPERGKDGLFHRKSFKTLLAKEPQLSGLSPQALSEHLQDAARALLQDLFGQLGH